MLTTVNKYHLGIGSVFFSYENLARRLIRSFTRKSSDLRAGTLPDDFLPRNPIMHLLQDKNNGKRTVFSDFLTLLTPVDHNGVPQGLIPGKSFIDGVKTQFDSRQKFWRARLAGFSDVYGLSALLDAEAAKSRSTVVRGRPNRSGVIRRTCAVGPGKTPHLDDVRHTWAMLDIDGVPNVWGTDPATAALLAAHQVRSLLPGDLARATCHYECSSSARMAKDVEGLWRPLPVGQAPDALRFHFWFVLSDALDGPALKGLLQRVNAAVRASLVSLGVAEIGDKLVDWKIAEAHMPHFVAAPTFGLSDYDGIPAADRCGLLGGEIDVVDLETLPKDLPAAIKPTKPTKPTRTSLVETAKTAHVRPLRLPATPSVVPLAQARDLLAVFAAAVPAQDAGGFKAWCVDVLFPARALFEMIAVAQDNRETRTGWQNGVPDGVRNDWMNALASLAIERLPLGLTDAEVRGRLRTVATAAGVCSDWLDAEWLALGYDTACVGRYRELTDAGGKPTREFRGKPCAATYRYRKNALVPLVSATPDQVRRLRLTSVALADDVRAAARRDAGTPTRAEMVAEARKHDRSVHALAASGATQADIATRLGLNRSAVVRALSRPLEALEVLPVTQTPEVAAMAVSVSPTAPTEALDGAVRYLVVSQGVDDAEGLSLALGETLSEVLAAMGRLGMLQLAA